MKSVFQVERTAKKLKGFRMENMRKTFPTPYPELTSVLQDFVESVQTVLGIKFVGAYLQGSFAVGHEPRLGKPGLAAGLPTLR
jgi:hypothetical protein